MTGGVLPDSNLPENASPEALLSAIGTQLDHEMSKPAADQLAPYPGVKEMPRWEVGELPDAPRFSWANLPMFIGPGLVMGAAAIGGGEWLTGPVVTARFGGALLWLATISIVAQTIYNIEISRYTLYTGEPIFTGKFRLPPGPMFWLFFYLLIDFGSLLPYLASNAAIPLAALILGKIPDPKQYELLLKSLACIIFVSVFIPLSVGGKVYNSLRAIMTFKLVTVVGFLMFLALLYSTPATWMELGSGFLKFGNLPVAANPENRIDNVDNFFVAMLEGRALRPIDYSVLGFLCTMVAISGNGGLTNTPCSNYTRDQGWGMGKHVGAIPSIVGGHSIALSHVGMVFIADEKSLPRWHRWMNHLRREQWCLWMPACFVGLALPSMLSVQFLERGLELTNKWQAAGMTAQGVADAVGGVFSGPFWAMTLFCGFLVLSTSMATTADGVLRRWVDVFWTANPTLRTWDVRHIGKLYFGVLIIYLMFGLLMLTLVKGDALLVASGILYNYALGVSCLHSLFVNVKLLPAPLKPGWGSQLGLLLGGVFFLFMAGLTTVVEWENLMKALGITVS